MKNWDDYVLFDAPIHILFLLHILIFYRNHNCLTRCKSEGIYTKSNYIMTNWLE